MPGMRHHIDRAKRLLMNIHSVYGVFMRWYRPRRMKAMGQYFGMTEETPVRRSYSGRVVSVHILCL